MLTDIILGYFKKKCTPIFYLISMKRMGSSKKNNPDINLLAVLCWFEPVKLVLAGGQAGLPV